MGRSGGDLAKRVAVASLGIPITVALAYLGGYWLAGLLALMASLAAWEFCAMYRDRGLPSSPLTAGLMALVYILLAASMPVREYTVWATVLTLVVAAALMLRTEPDSRPGLTAIITLFAAAYTGALLVFGQWLRAIDGTVPSWRGAAIIFLPVGITWLGDTAAYFVGRAVGRHKLAPTISPKKTWEGAVAGFLATVVGAALWVALTQPLVSWTMTLLEVVGLGAAVAVAGQIGDLFESRFKRDCDVKDSSNLLPGHGGVLDRLDALLFAFPVTYAYLGLVGV
ncbi:MAG: phosphatidate cytidylyltransferase [Gemmatimonadota bacterium]|jgi:phosphatidate cytidylyltransferase